MKTNFLLLTCCTILILSLTACFRSETSFLQGTWETSNVHVFESWTFNGGRFAKSWGNRMNSPNTLAGNFQIVENEEEKLVVELYDLEGQFLWEDTQQVVIILDQQADTITIGGKTFTRLHP